MAPARPHSGKRPAHPANVAPANVDLVVDPVWLLKAGGIVILAALLCGYLTFCLLFYQGQWQLILHPNRSKAAPATIAGTPFETVHFGVDESGLPQLTGWWIPAPPDGRFATGTILYLPSGDGSLADAEPTLAALHTLGINIFAFDYRGYGQSVAMHPNEQRMIQDTASAWQYLITSRKLSSSRIIPFGAGVGAALAAQLTASHESVPGVILQSPRPDLMTTVRSDARVRLLPVRVLFRDTFDVAASVTTLKTSKLFLLQNDPTGLELARAAADPKIIITLPVAQTSSPAYLETIARFLDQFQIGKPEAK